MKVNLTFVRNEEKISKAGKKYTACSIKTKEHGDKWINGFGNAQTKEWESNAQKDGLPLEVAVEIYEEEYNGQTYTKFKTLSETTLLEERVKKLEEAVFGTVEKVQAKYAEATTRTSADNIPF